MKLKFILLSLLTNIQSTNNYGRSFDDNTVQHRGNSQNQNKKSNEVGVQSSRISQNDNQGFYDASQQTDDSRYKISLSDNQLYNEMIPKELEEDCEKVGINIRQDILHKNLDDDSIYKLVAEKLMPKEVALIYLPLTSIGLSLLLLTLFSYMSVGHKDTKETAKFGDLFSFYFSIFKIEFLVINIVLICLNIGVYYLIQNFRFNMLYIICTYIFVVPLIAGFIFFINIFLFLNNTKEELSKQEKEKNKIFKNTNIIIDQNINIGLDKKYRVFEFFLKICLIQLIYLVYYGYKINKLNTLQDKFVVMKNNLSQMKGFKKLNEIQTKTIVEANEQENRQNVNTQTYETYRQSNGNFVC